MKGEIFKILKESVSLYFKNIFRLMEIVTWIVLPASIFFVLIFYWGLPQQALYALGAVSYPSAFILLLLLNAVVIKIIQAIDAGRCLSALSAYASVFSLFGAYLWVLALISLRIMLWSLPFFFSYFIAFWIRQSGGPLWPFSLSLVFLAPIFLTACHYFFSPLAFWVDGRRGNQALLESKKIVKPNFWKFLGNAVVLSLMMAPFYGQIFRWMEKIMNTPLSSTNLFPLLLSNCLINLLAVTIHIFPMVFFYFLYKELHTRCHCEERSDEAIS